MEDNFKWDDENVKQFCEYAGLRIGKTQDIRQQLNMLQEDFKATHSGSTEQQEKDWEILEWYNPKQRTGEPHKKVYGEYWSCEKMGCIIYSVRRLSDQIIFSIGDEVEWGKEHYRASARITKLYIDKDGYYPENNGLYFDTDGNKHNNHIGFISAANLQKKLPPQPQKEEQGKQELPKCGICGGRMVMIRSRYPGSEDRATCPTCTQERLDQINEISSSHYGQTSQVK